MDRIKLLLITNYFPPVQSVASLRMQAFVRYLPSDRYEIKVVCQSADGRRQVTKLPGGAEVCAIPNRRFIRFATFSSKTSFLLHKMKAGWNRLLIFFRVGEVSGWKHDAFLESRNIVNSWKPDVILTSYPYLASLKIGFRLKNEFPEVKWVMDLRDALATNPFIPEYKRKRLRKLEVGFIKHADAVAAVSEPILSHFRDYNTGHTSYCEIRNGYDFEPGNPGSFNDIFTITYAGTFYAGRNPEVFFKAIRVLLNDGRMDDVKVNFSGVGNAVKVPQDLKKRIMVSMKMPYADIVSQLKDSDALLLVLPSGPYKGVFSGKIFDYLGTGRPVIALIDPDDVAAGLIRQSGCGYVAAFDDVNQTVQAILWAYDLWQQKKLPPVDQEVVGLHHRKVQVERLDKLILSLCPR
jgi:hypothetical protein